MTVRSRTAKASGQAARPGKAKKVRRRPRQERAQQTVDAVLDSVTRLLKRRGLRAVTTNRIAEVAGVSIGSVYQYFPDKQAIFSALLDRHLAEIGAVVEAKLAAHDEAPLDGVVRALVEGMIASHAKDPALHQLLFTQVPHAPDDADLDTRMRRALRRAIEPRAKELRAPRDLDRLLFVLSNMVESLAHAVVLARPSRLSLEVATEDAVHAVLAVLHA
ncbi:MAG TPA: TetR/AcrR family transcriptional regulator [Polyangiaceae bacterium]|nr:TetR/AcrR family transcriptional regulator [Polyangiaceae bacterium]